VIDRAVILSSGQFIEPAHLAGLADGPAPENASMPFRLPNDGCHLDDVERSLVMQALDRAGGNQTRAATLLGVHRDQIRYRLGKYKKTAG
jgi:DNA-binding NtrC family response regulator